MAALNEQKFQSFKSNVTEFARNENNFFPGAFIRDEQFSLVNEVHENIEQLPK